MCPQSPSSDKIPMKQPPHPGIGQRPILQPEGGPGLAEEVLDRNLIQHSSQVLARQPGEWAPGLQEDGTQAQPYSPGPRMDTENTGPYLDKGKRIMSRTRHTEGKAPRADFRGLRLHMCSPGMDVSSNISLCNRAACGKSKQNAPQELCPTKSMLTQGQNNIAGSPQHQEANNAYATEAMSETHRKWPALITRLQHVKRLHFVHKYNCEEKKLLEKVHRKVNIITKCWENLFS